MVYLQRYYIDKKWTPKKIEARVAVPDTLDLEHLRSKGLQPGENELKEQPGAAAAAGDTEAAPHPEANGAIVEQLVAMGFSENGAKRATLATGNSDVQVAMEWVMNHMGDADFNDPLPAAGAAPTSAGAADEFQADPSSVEMLGAMGFSAEHAAIALGMCGGSLERAADWLFSHPDPVAAAAEAKSGAGGPTAATGEGGAAAAAPEDGPGRYELVGFISHIGSNTACGHYVAHIRRGGRWAIFNDEKVAASQQPPRELGYMYLYRRAP